MEINSTFYRPHREATWKRWAAETPEHFRFAIKAPKLITHESCLHSVELLLRQFLAQIEPLGQKTGPLLFQLPPSLEFNLASAEIFLRLLRNQYAGQVALEPRHPTWFTGEVNDLLAQFQIARVAADPPKGGSEAATTGGSASLAYYRWHGAPRTYYSAYSDDALQTLAKRISCQGNVWVIFDNTALSHAYANAHRLLELDAPPRVQPGSQK